MLLGLDPLLTPDLLHALASAGHGDRIAIVDANFPAASTARRLVSTMGDPVNMNGGTLVGGYESIARMLDEIAEVEGLKGVMLTFDEFLTGLDNFAEFVQPLMKSRAKINGVA